MLVYFQHDNLSTPLSFFQSLEYFAVGVRAMTAERQAIVHHSRAVNNKRHLPMVLRVHLLASPSSGCGRTRTTCGGLLTTNERGFSQAAKLYRQICVLTHCFRHSS